MLLINIYIILNLNLNNGWKMSWLLTALVRSVTRASGGTIKKLPRVSMATTRKLLSTYSMWSLNVVMMIGGIILCMCPANKRRCYNVTSSLIGSAHIKNDPWWLNVMLLWLIVVWMVDCCQGHCFHEWSLLGKVQGWFSIKMLSYHCRDSHYKCETVMRPSYLYNENSYNVKIVYLLNWLSYPVSIMMKNVFIS